MTFNLKDMLYCTWLVSVLSQHSSQSKRPLSQPTGGSGMASSCHWKQQHLGHLHRQRNVCYRAQPGCVNWSWTIWKWTSCQKFCVTTPPELKMHIWQLQLFSRALKDCCVWTLDACSMSNWEKFYFVSGGLKMCMRRVAGYESLITQT